jgi:hypothetical protein
MSEFKGTKEGWGKLVHHGDIKKDDCFWIQIGKPMEKIIAEVKGIHYGIDNIEATYNAKLISKAPEMLEMLEKCERTLREIHGFDTIEIKNLIKEATEI